MTAGGCIIHSSYSSLRCAQNLLERTKKYDKGILADHDNKWNYDNSFKTNSTYSMTRHQYDCKYCISDYRDNCKYFSPDPINFCKYCSTGINLNHCDKDSRECKYCSIRSKNTSRYCIPADKEANKCNCVLPVQINRQNSVDREILFRQNEVHRHRNDQINLENWRVNCHFKRVKRLLEDVSLECAELNSKQTIKNEQELRHFNIYHGGCKATHDNEIDVNLSPGKYLISREGQPMSNHVNKKHVTIREGYNTHLNLPY